MKGTVSKNQSESVEKSTLTEVFTFGGGVKATQKAESLGKIYRAFLTSHHRVSYMPPSRKPTRKPEDKGALVIHTFHLSKGGGRKVGKEGQREDV